MKYKLLFIALMTAMAVQAQTVKTKSVSMFGMATSFKDSVVYVTPIHSVPGARVEGKTGILVNRATYTEQLRYELNNKGLTDRTIVVFFNRDDKKLEKRRQQLQKRYIQKLHYQWKELKGQEFLFKSVTENTLP